MNSAELRQLTGEVIALVRRTGEFVRAERSRLADGDFEVKGQGDFVSRVDRESEDLLRAGLQSLLPGSRVMAEEQSPEERGGDWRWIVDPLDGTANYLMGLPVYAISVALEDRRGNPDRFGPILLGVVGEAELDAVYDAFKGGGARRNGTAICVNETRDLEYATVATAFPFRQREHLDPFFALFRAIYPKVADFRRIGAAASDLCWVADGTLDGYFEMELKPWDVAAGEIIVREAGGMVSDWWGLPVCETGWVNAGSPRTHAMLEGEIRRLGFPRPERLFR